LKSVSSQTAEDTDALPTVLKVGSHPFSANRESHAFIKNVKFYNRALTDSEMISESTQ
jgi:hypothetical protein